MSLAGVGFVNWDLRDRDGSNVSNGIYYLLARVEGNGVTTVKTFKILVVK
jgi:hypothetical protein